MLAQNASRLTHYRNTGNNCCQLNSTIFADLKNNRNLIYTNDLVTQETRHGNETASIKAQLEKPEIGCMGDCEGGWVYFGTPLDSVQSSSDHSQGGAESWKLLQRSAQPGVRSLYHPGMPGQLSLHTLLPQPEDCTGL